VTAGDVEVCTLEDVRPDWVALQESLPSVFSTWEWADVWWRHHGRGEQRVTRLRAGGAAAALAPTYLSAFHGLRILRLIGHGPADDLGPVAADPEAGAAALDAALRRCGNDHDLFVGEHLEPGASGGRVIGRTRAPVLRFEHDTWEAFLASKSRNLRQQVGRRARNLERRHRVELTRSDRGRLDADLATLFALHRDRWGDGTAFGRDEAFHREFARVALDRGWLRLWLLHADGVPVAAWYGFRRAGVEQYYQAGWDGRYAHLSVGFVLLAHTIRSALEDGMREYRFLQGFEPYKYRFANGESVSETSVVPRTPVGRVAAGGARVLTALPPLRRSVGRRMGFG
jgi:CelD/BcsL family acetyltransferase involved in cellulose biosynthesis